MYTLQWIVLCGERYSAIVWKKHRSNRRGIKKNKFVSPPYTHIYYHIMLMLISHYKGKTSFTLQYQFLVNYFLIQSCVVTVLCSYWVGLIFVSVLKLETILLVILRYLTHMIIVITFSRSCKSCFQNLSRVRLELILEIISCWSRCGVYRSKCSN